MAQGKYIHNPGKTSLGFVSEPYKFLLNAAWLVFISIFLTLIYSFNSVTYYPSSIQHKPRKHTHAVSFSWLRESYGLNINILIFFLL